MFHKLFQVKNFHNFFYNTTHTAAEKAVVDDMTDITPRLFRVSVLTPLTLPLSIFQLALY